MANCEKRKAKTIVNRKDIITKRRKIERVDIISNLPESILHHIISFLPTRCAVSTCILSKTWKDLWMSTTNLRFTVERKQQITKYPLFIDHVLHRHSSNITSFYLDTSTCSSSYTAPKMDLDDTLLESWIYAAVNRQVQHVGLLLSSMPVLSLPPCLCNSNMLTSLELRRADNLVLPSKIYLPSLKILGLYHVRFSDHSALDRLLSGLPHIEELKLVFDYWSGVKQCTISLPTLRRLTIQHDQFVSYLSDCVVNVNAENLVYFNCGHDLSLDVYLNNLLSLAEAEIRVWCFEDRESCSVEDIEAYRCRATNLLAGLSSAKSLKLAGGSLASLRYLSSQGNHNFFPRFVNLTALHISSEVTKYSAPALIDIIRNAPILESVVIQEVAGKWSSDAIQRYIASSRIEFSLKNFTILRFGGEPGNLRFVKFVLKASKELKCLALYCTENLCKQKKKLQDIMNELKILPKDSCSCVIEFVVRDQD